MECRHLKPHHVLAAGATNWEVVLHWREPAHLRLHHCQEDSSLSSIPAMSRVGPTFAMHFVSSVLLQAPPSIAAPHAGLQPTVLDQTRWWPTGPLAVEMVSPRCAASKNLPRSLSMPRKVGGSSILEDRVSQWVLPKASAPNTPRKLARCRRQLRQRANNNANRQGEQAVQDTPQTSTAPRQPYELIKAPDITVATPSR
jgi:hypothetical protein